MLDSKDKKIAAHLRFHGRDSIREIAKATELRPSTVHQRLLHLEKEKTIEYYTAKFNNEDLSEGFIVFLWMTTKEDLPSSFFHNPSITECFGITGEYDLLLKLKFPSLKEFNQYIIALRKNKIITKTLTQIVTITLKEEL